MNTALAMNDDHRPEQSPVPAAMKAEYDRLAALTDDALGDELGATLSLTAQHFAKLAMILRVKEERGHDLSDLKIGMVGYLRKIAYGQLLPEVLADFGHSPSLLRRISGLPTPDQTRVVRDGVTVGIPRPGGAVDAVKIPASSLTPAQASAVFAPDHIRTPEEQVRQLRFTSHAASEPRPEPPPYTISGNACVVNRACRLTKRDVQNILKAMG